eukprot:GHVU01042483.1.p6 GENE.GHVU01042483.1~~GHVU01042483.1.p6  ORF type:complete len:157 (-),score=36.00 GHVU01042483.1:924-1394(-)
MSEFRVGASRWRQGAVAVKLKRQGDEVAAVGIMRVNLEADEEGGAKEEEDERRNGEGETKMDEQGGGGHEDAAGTILDEEADTGEDDDKHIPNAHGLLPTSLLPPSPSAQQRMTKHSGQVRSLIHPWTHSSIPSPFHSSLDPLLHPSIVSSFRWFP